MRFKATETLSITVLHVFAATCYFVNNCTDSSQGQCLTTDVCLCTPGYTGKVIILIFDFYEQNKTPKINRKGDLNTKWHRLQ